LIGDHKAHIHVLAEIAADNAKGILKDAIVPIQETITRAEMEIKTTQEEIKVLQGEIKEKEEKIKETKKKIDDSIQKIEEIKSILSKSQVDSFMLLSMASNLKLELNSHSKPFENIAIWLNKPVRNWKLLYKWTKDEKTPQAWHSQCDNKGPTVTVIWANGGYIFGGYAQLPWTSQGGYKYSKESFLFSLTDGRGRKPYQCLQAGTKYANNPYSVCHDPNYIGWGKSFDLGLQIPPNPSSYSRLGATYKLPDGFNSDTFLAGHHNNWTIEEIETYLV